MHYKFSPSGSKKWLNCGGSLALIESLKKKGLIPQESTNDASELGTGVHEVGEICLNRYIEYLNSYKSKVVVEPKNYYNAVVNKHVMTSDCIDAVTIYYEYCKHAIDVNGPGYSWVETKNVHPKCKDLGGTSDFVSLCFIDGVLEIVDYKNGTGVVVWAEDNTQGMIYAILTYYSLSDIHRSKIKEVRITICQPRHHLYKDNDGLDSWKISIEELLAWEKDVLFPQIRKIEAGTTELNPSEGACQWCEAWNHCDARERIVDRFKSILEGEEELGDLDLDGDELDDLFTISDSTMVDADTETYIDSQIEGYDRKSWVLDNEKLILNYIKKSKEYAEKELLDGREFPNMKVVQGLKNTSYLIDNVDYVKRCIIDTFGGVYGKREDLTKPEEPISYSDLKVHLKNKGINKEDIDNFIDVITHRPDGDFKLVELSDKRESVRRLKNMVDSIDITELQDTDPDIDFSHWED